MSTTEKTETKTETKSAPANPFAGNPFATNPFVGFEAIQKMIGEMHQRMSTFATEYATLEAQMFTRAQSAVANWAQLANEAIAYSAQMSVQARKLGLETARKFSATTGA